MNVEIGSCIGRAMGLVGQLQFLNTPSLGCLGGWRGGTLEIPCCCRSSGEHRALPFTLSVLQTHFTKNLLPRLRRAERTPSREQPAAVTLAKETALATWSKP